MAEKKEQIVLRYVDPQVKHEFKVYCAKLGKPMSEVITGWILKALEEEKKK